MEFFSPLYTRSAITSAEGYDTAAVIFAELFVCEREREQYYSLNLIIRAGREKLRRREKKQRRVYMV